MKLHRKKKRWRSLSSTALSAVFCVVGSIMITIIFLGGVAGYDGSTYGYAEYAMYDVHAEYG
jgi:hypothetical protein